MALPSAGPAVWRPALPASLTLFRQAECPQDAGRKNYSGDRVIPRRPIIRSRNFRPCFLYVSDPARRKASQIRAALCPSRSAIASISFFRFDCTLKLRRVSFLIEEILALCRSQQFGRNLLTQDGNSVILMAPICHPFWGLKEYSCDLSTP